MSETPWYSKFGGNRISLPTEPLGFADLTFDNTFVRTQPYDQVDSITNGIRKTDEKFWITSPGSGYGKSTMLNYITRNLLVSLDKMKTLPFLVRVPSLTYYEKVMNEIQRQCIAWFIGFVKTIGQIEKQPGFSWSDGDYIAHLKPWFSKYDTQDSESSVKENLYAFSRYPSSISYYFERLLNDLQTLEARGFISRYALLIDGVDRLTPGSLESFLIDGQTLVEDLYGKYHFVCFFSADSETYQSLVSSGKCTYYEGPVIGLQPVVTAIGAKSLLEKHMKRKYHDKANEIPWTDEGYEKLLQYTNIPRRVLRLGVEVINHAILNKSERLDERLVSEALSSSHTDILTWLSKRPEFAGRLERTLRNGSFSILIACYEHQALKLLKSWDTDKEWRLKRFGMVIDDATWQRKIGYLVQDKFLLSEQDYRHFGKEVEEFFDYMKVKEFNPHRLPDALRTTHIL